MVEAWPCPIRLEPPERDSHQLWMNYWQGLLCGAGLTFAFCFGGADPNNTVWRLTVRVNCRGYASRAFLVKDPELQYRKQRGFWMLQCRKRGAHAELGVAKI